jgi:hypothetical protein
MATFHVSISGLASQSVVATELDDDIGANLALASAGSTIAGGWGATKLIDGIHLASTNYGYTVWTNVPPAAMTLDLKVPTAVSRLRLLNYDWDARIHRYRIESSLDGTTWSNLVDAGTGEHMGWEDWATNRTARYLRFTGLSNSANKAVCLAEWEVYGGNTTAKRSFVVPENKSASSQDGFVAMESEPVSVVTSDDVAPNYESGWAAVDGDSKTAWVGQKPGGGHLVVEYAPALKLKTLGVDLAEGSLTNIEYLYSLDAQDWQPLPMDIESNPVSLNLLWLLFPDDGTTAVPKVLEIRPNP